jgi:hypothetical protein
MTTDTTSYQLHETTTAALPAQWAWQVGGAWLGGVGVDWDTSHVNFNLRGRGGKGGGGGEERHYIKQYCKLNLYMHAHLRS